MSATTINERTYLWVYLALLALLGLTITGAYIPIHWLASFIALVIAGIKTALIVLYFMHVRESSTRTRVFASAALLWLGILIIGTLHDYLSRSWLAAS